MSLKYYRLIGILANGKKVNRKYSKRSLCIDWIKKIYPFKGMEIKEELDTGSFIEWEIKVRFGKEGSRRLRFHISEIEVYTVLKTGKQDQIVEMNEETWFEEVKQERLYWEDGIVDEDDVDWDKLMNDAETDIGLKE